MNNSEPVEKEILVDAPAGTVWEALTDSRKIKQWSFDIPEFVPEEGLEFKFYGGTNEKQYLHLCRILEVVNQRRLSYSWRYEGYEGNTVVTFELFPEGNKTRVSLSHKGIETFPKDNPDLTRERFDEGWEQIMLGLKKYLTDN